MARQVIYFLFYSIFMGVNLFTFLLFLINIMVDPTALEDR